METANLLAEICFQSRAEHLRWVRHEIRSACEKYVQSTECVDHIVIAINEACMNIIEHAYGQECSAEIVLKIYIEQNQLIFHLIDFAKPSSPDCIKPRRIDISQPGGLGVFLINEVMDEVRFLDAPPEEGNVLEMKKSLQK